MIEGSQIPGEPLFFGGGVKEDPLSLVSGGFAAWSVMKYHVCVWKRCGVGSCH